MGVRANRRGVAVARSPAARRVYVRPPERIYSSEHGLRLNAHTRLHVLFLCFYVRRKERPLLTTISEEKTELFKIGFSEKSELQ